MAKKKELPVFKINVKVLEEDRVVKLEKELEELKKAVQQTQIQGA